MHNGVFRWNIGQSRNPYAANLKSQPLLHCFITLGLGLHGYEFEIILILADISRFCPSSRDTGSDREMSSFWMFMDWRTACCWGITEVSDMKKKLIIYDLFLNKNQCTYPTLTFQSIEIKSNRRTSVQTYFKICHFSLPYLRKFTFVPPVSKVFYLIWKRVTFTQNGRKNYFRTKEIEAEKVLTRNVNVTCAINIKTLSFTFVETPVRMPVERSAMFKLRMYREAYQERHDSSRIIWMFLEENQLWTLSRIIRLSWKAGM